MKYSRTRKTVPLVVVRDTREQYQPAWPDGVECQTAHLAYGDYSAAGLTDVAALELKWSLGDLVACCTFERERFERCLKGMNQYPVRALIVADTLEAVHAHRYRSSVPPKIVIASTWAWAQDGIPTIWAGSAQGATNAIVWWLRRAQMKRAA